MTEDFQLAQAWKDGDRGAGDVLLDRYFTQLYRFFVHKVQAAEEAQELTQETLEALTTAIKRFEGRSSFRTYLFSIARRKLIGHFERRAGSHRFDALSSTIGDLGTSPSQALHREDERAQLRAELETLPVEHQMLMELFYWEGMSAKELAVVFEIDQGTVRTRLHRWRAVLRERLEKTGMTRIIPPVPD